MSDDPASTAPEPLAERLSGLVAERPRNSYPSGVMIGLRSVQRVYVSAGRFGPSWSPRLVLAKWALQGSGAMEIGDQRLVFGPGQVAIYLPTIPHRFWALAARNRFSWFSIDGPFAESFVMELGLRPGVYSVPPPAHRQVQAMALSLADQTTRGRRKASLLAIAEWYRIADAIGAKAPASAGNQVRGIIAERFADPELSTRSLAAQLGLHRGSLSRLFHREAGCTLVDYMAKTRLQEAQSLLQHGDESLTGIARQCGLRDASYFGRWFKKLTGTTPASYRREHQRPA
jgi:AraC-like DNA-binding protein